ncbi:MAG: hypothetical protein OEO79_11290, partial [Gemmatimonadota bacterium]|nr:hypothetical protein [Gemmatimonadota bacterium]
MTAAIGPTRTLKAVLTLLALGIAGCQSGSDPLGVNGGRVQFVLSGGAAVSTPGAALAPAATGDDDDHDDDRERDRHPYFVSANVTFASILARNVSGQLIDAGMDLPATVDIVAMEERGRAVTLPDGDLPLGMYDQIVVVMTEVEGVLHDGTTITITPPGGGWTAIVPVCPFDIEDGGTEIVGLVLPVRSAF